MVFVTHLHSNDNNNNVISHQPQEPPQPANLEDNMTRDDKSNGGTQVSNASNHLTKKKEN